MSTLNSNPSPNKGTSTKRPYEVTTPSNLGTPRDSTSVLNGRSPGPSKKPRPNGEDGREISRGGQWMIAKLDELQRMYKEVLLAATTVIQYQTYCLKIGRRERGLPENVPVHLQRRVKVSWGNFVATRRQVQAYMHAAAQDASTPSSKHLTIPVLLPPPSTSLTIPNQDVPTSTIPIASPIPLSASTMLAFPDLPPTDLVPKVEPVPPVKPINNEFDFNILPTLPSNNGLGNLDLGNINMDDFAAMIANSGFDYGSTGNQQPPTITNQPSQNQNQNQNQGMNGIQPNTLSSNTTMNVNNANREQSDTDRLLAQLGAFTGSGPSNQVNQNQNQVQVQQQQQQQQQQPPNSGMNTLGEQDVDALLASLNDNNGNGNGSGNMTDFTNFDFGDIDLSNLGDMSGLFNTSTAPDVASLTQSQPQSHNQQMGNTTMSTQSTSLPNTNPVQAQPPPQTQNPPAQIQPEPSLPTNPNPAQVNQNPLDSNLDVSNVFDESQPIDLDDFNFGNGDEGGGEGGIDLTGDEFENLLAAFN